MRRFPSLDQEPDSLSYRTVLDPGDYLVLCTDGLGKHVSDTEMEDIIGSSSSVFDACEKLVEAALEGGGSDNITVIVGRLLDEGEEDSKVADGVGAMDHEPS